MNGSRPCSLEDFWAILDVLLPPFSKHRALGAVDSCPKSGVFDSHFALQERMTSGGPEGKHVRADGNAGFAWPCCLPPHFLLHTKVVKSSEGCRLLYVSEVNLSDKSFPLRISCMCKALEPPHHERPSDSLLVAVQWETPYAGQ